MKVLIVYGTNSGGTEEVAELIAEKLQPNHQAVLKNAEDAKPTDLNGFAMIVLGACTWDVPTPNGILAGQLQQHMHEFTEKILAQKKKFPNTRFAVFGLGDENYTHFCNAAIRLQTFVNEVHGKLIVEPLKINQYFFHLEKNRTLVSRWADELLKHLT